MTNAGRHSYSRSQETGAIRLLQPLSRAKEERMRVSAGVFHLLSVVLLFSAAAPAADLKVKVVDPQGAAVAGAQVSLFVTGTETSLSLSFTKIAMTSAEGIATFAGLPSSSYQVQVQVLAAGFAPYKQIDPGSPKEML